MSQQRLRLKGHLNFQTILVQLGGGFMSFDALDVHFGLGDVQDVKSVSVRWPDGGVDEFGPLTAGAIYGVTRH